MVKRGVIDTLRRGLDNTLANWPVIALRLAGKVVFGVILVAAGIAIIVPILVRMGLHVPNINSPEDVLDVLTTLINAWVWIFWIVVVVSVVLLILIAVQSFIEAGCARIAVDADRAAGSAEPQPRARFQVFAMSRWLAGAVEGWGPVFWIYNLAWGFTVLFLLIPLLPTMVAMLLLRDNDTAVIVIGIGGLIVTMLFFVLIAIVTSVWTNRAIAEWAARRESARVSLRRAWTALKRDLARHALIALAIFVVAAAGSSFFAGFGAFATIGQAMSRAAIIQFVTMPIRLAGWLVSSAFSAAIATWFLAAYAALAVEE